MAEGGRMIVLGLGTFGAAVARSLHQYGCRVTGVDQREDRVEVLKDILYEAIVADVTEREVLEQLSVDQARAVFVGLGERYERSILTALHLKELGAKYVLVKGVTHEHGKVLEKLGVDRVIYPEEEIARYWAAKAVWPNVLDFLPIDPEYAIIEMAVPEELSNKTLAEADLRRKYGVMVLAVKDALLDRLELVPGGDYRLSEDQKLIVIGRRKDLRRLYAGEFKSEL